MFHTLTHLQLALYTTGPCYALPDTSYSLEDTIGIALSV